MYSVVFLFAPAQRLDVPGVAFGSFSLWKRKIDIRSRTEYSRAPIGLSTPKNTISCVFSLKLSQIVHNLKYFLKLWILNFFYQVLGDATCLIFTCPLPKLTAMDRLVHGLAADATIRIMAAVTTETVRESVRRHKTSPTTTCALGRALTGTLLMGSSLKDFDRLTVKIVGDGPVEGIITEAVIGGKVRGYVRNPVAEVVPKPSGELNVPGIIGRGMIHVIREAGFDIGLRREPYVGSIEIGSGEVAEDLANYLLTSEQIPSAVLLGEKLMKDEPFVRCAGGVMIQMLPGFDENHAVMIEDTIRHAPSISHVIEEGATPEELLSMTLGLIDYQILGETPVSFECGCSLERARGLIASLGSEEIRAMISEDCGAKMTCGFCNEIYKLSEEDLVAML